MNKGVNPLALGSDVARSRKQLWLRKIAKFIISLLGLNKDGALATEILQASNPVISIPTLRLRSLVCRGGHGRLKWRAESFLTEEPDTIAWLDQLTSDDIYWDIGANVGLYAIYAAKFCHCKVLAFEPEAQNYSLLIDNMILNGMFNNDKFLASPVALAEKSGFGRLQMRYFTKGGAHNLFVNSDNDEVPLSIQAVVRESLGNNYQQLNYSTTLDDLIYKHNFPYPTHIKIDVDGTEPKIIKGGKNILASRLVKSILIEVNKKSEDDKEMLDYLIGNGYKMIVESPVWGTKPERSREADYPVANIILNRI